MLIAFLSLVLLLVVEGILTSILLRTNKGNVSKFGFSIKQVIELIRDFNIRPVMKGKHRKAHPVARINWKQLALALSILLFMFGLEVGILFLTDPELANVTNSMVTFRIQQHITPKWIFVDFSIRASINRPCSSVALLGVVQGPTRINTCVTVDGSQGSMDFLSLNSTGAVDAEIKSDIHEYGAEHNLTVDTLSATYSTRAYFTLQDKKARLMKSLSSSYEEEHMEVMHRQFIAFLFSSFLKSKNFEDEDVVFENLKGTAYHFTASEGPIVDVMKIGNTFQRSKSRRYVSTLTGVLPRGTPVLRIGQQIFRGSSGIVASEPDEGDLFLEEGKRSRQSIIWQENARVMNWLSLAIIIVCALLIQV